MINILAIESSCDDTSAAVLSDGEVLSNIVASQEDHSIWGGVIPEVASRAHLRLILPVVTRALEKAGMTLQDINALAITSAPGLLGSLHVGVSFIKALGLANHLPIIDVNHMDAHIASNFLEDKKPDFPFLCLTVSGGHTQISLVRSLLDIQVIGRTIDDAAGEAFDKSGKLLGLSYPSGPLIDKLAKKGHPIYSFPEPEIPELNFSFSGLKTSILYFLKKQVVENPDFITQNMENICASIQERIVSILVKKLLKASELTGIKEIALAGGVSANSSLRSSIQQTALDLNWNVYIPRLSYCTDNAAMIGIQAFEKYKAGQFADADLSASPR